MINDFLLTHKPFHAPLKLIQASKIEMQVIL